MNEEFASLSRDFESAPEMASALELVKSAGRLARDWPVSLCRWVFDWPRWTGLKESEKEFFANRVASQPSLIGWSYVELCSVESPVHKSSLPLFTHTRFPDSSFVLVPGACAKLGYDASQALQCAPSSLDDILQATAIFEDFELTPKAPLVSIDDLYQQEVRASLSLSWKEDFIHSFLREHLSEWLTDVRTVTLQPLLTEVSPTWRWASVSETLTEGFRLPTHDEWEYLRAGGTRSLFSWGDDHRAGHRGKANGFGLQFSNSSYDYEICSDDYARGGDGGGAACGGQGYFFEQLNSSPYFKAEQGHETMLGYWSDHLRYRRVFPLIPEPDAH